MEWLVSAVNGKLRGYRIRQAVGEAQNRGEFVSLENALLTSFLLSSFSNILENNFTGFADDAK